MQDINGAHVNTLTVPTNEGGLISSQTNPVYFRATSSVPTITTIVATYENQSVSFTITSTTTPPAPVTDMPIPPDNLVSQDNGDGTFSLSWTDNSSNENGFYIYRQNTDGVWDAIGFVGKGITFFKDTTLQAAAPGQVPNYQAGAVAQDGTEMISGQSNPQAPFQFALIDLGAGRNPSRVADNGWVLAGNERWKWGTWETLTNAKGVSDMNASGVVVGNMDAPNNSTRPALWAANSTSPSTWPNITPADGPTDGNASVIGDNGEIYGYRVTWDNVSADTVTNTTIHFKSNGSATFGTELSSSFVTSNSSTGETTASGGSNTRIIDINASGNYVFSRTDTEGNEEYFSKIGTTEKALSYVPRAINNQNIIAGVNASGKQYIIDEGSGNMQLLTPSSGMASSIHLSSDPNGDYTVIAGENIWKRLFDEDGMLENGFSRFKLSDFVSASSGWSDVVANHTSSNGFIAGSGKRNGVQHGFMIPRVEFGEYISQLDPKPEGHLPNRTGNNAQTTLPQDIDEENSVLIKWDINSDFVSNYGGQISFKVVEASPETKGNLNLEGSFNSADFFSTNGSGSVRFIAKSEFKEDKCEDVNPSNQRLTIGMFFDDSKIAQVETVSAVPRFDYLFNFSFPSDQRFLRSVSYNTWKFVSYPYNIFYDENLTGANGYTLHNPLSLPTLKVFVGPSAVSNENRFASTRIHENSHFEDGSSFVIQASQGRAAFLQWANISSINEVTQTLLDGLSTSSLSTEEKDDILVWTSTEIDATLDQIDANNNNITCLNSTDLALINFNLASYQIIQNKILQ